MDRFLLQSWAAAKDAAPPILYASIRLVMRCTQRDPLSIEETTNARAALFMTEGTATDPRPLAFVFFDARSRHYFFCVFDYQRLYAFTWGRAFNKAGHEKGKWRNGPWRDGPRVWERLALVLGRHGTPDPIAWRGFNWLQVSLLFHLPNTGLPCYRMDTIAAQRLLNLPSTHLIVGPLLAVILGPRNQNWHVHTPHAATNAARGGCWH